MLGEPASAERALQEDGLKENSNIIEQNMS
jgi:hypothetical protein